MSAHHQRLINAVVVSAGLMQKTVKVRVGSQEWNSRVQKLYSRPQHLLVHDPNNSLRAGDVVSVASGWRVSKHVHHVVHSIIAPFGSQIDQRPPVPTEEERVKARELKKAAKSERRQARREAEESEAQAEQTA